MNVEAHRTRRIVTALVLGVSVAVVAVPVAQADAVDRGIVAPRATGPMQVSPDLGALDPLVGDAIRAEQRSPALDPLIADAIRAAEARSSASKGTQGQPDFWNYDTRTGEKTSNTSPGLRPSDLAEVYSPTGEVSPDGKTVDFRTPTASPSPISSAGGTSFQWEDAGIGAGAMLALVVVLAGVGTLLVRRRHGLLASQ
jgi:hypothetical protein